MDWIFVGLPRPRILATTARLKRFELEITYAVADGIGFPTFHITSEIREQEENPSIEPAAEDTE